MSQISLPKTLIFKPYYKSVIWGGKRISELKGEYIDCPELGESWEISAIEGHESTVDGGPLTGKKITDLSRIYGAELLGQEVVDRYGLNFPLLIKLIDARDILSVQVHPNDVIAAQRHNGRGKSEMWYVIHADNNAEIFCGLKAPLTPDDYIKRIGDKSIMDVVAKHKSQVGQFYYIPSGTIHSIGAGNLLAEIQESSDITYRVYDHNRHDSKGQKRELHTEAAREAIDYSYPQTVEPTAKIYGGSTDKVVACEHFIVDYISLNDSDKIIGRNEGSFTAVMVVEGTLTLEADGEKTTLTAGHTALVPAFVRDIKLNGTGKALSTHL